MPLNKYSSPEEVKTFYSGIDPHKSLMAHITKFYPMEPIRNKLTQPFLEKIIRTLLTKAMEAI